MYVMLSLRTQTVMRYSVLLLDSSVMSDMNDDITTTQDGEEQPLVTEEHSRSIQTKSGGTQKLTYLPNPVQTTCCESLL